GVNYLLGVGPMSSGEFCDDIYKNMAIVAEWMKQNGESMHAVRPLTNGESASVPAVAHESVRYLFAIRKFKGDGKYDQDILPASDETLALKGIASKPASVKLLGDGSELKFEYSDGAVNVELPAMKRTKLVDVVKIELAS